MTSRKYFFLILKSLIATIATLGLFLIMLSFMNLSITLDNGHRVFTEQIKSLTGRDAHVDGEIKLTVSLTPRLLVQRIQVSNPDDINDEYFITLNEAQVAVSLIPLLSGQLHFNDITAEHAKINLTKMEDGSNNWSFDTFSQPSKLSETEAADNDTKKSGMDQFSLGSVKLTNVQIVYSDESRNQVIEDQIDQLIIDLKDIKNPYAEISGNIQDRPYTIKFKTDALDILAAGEPWQLHGSGHIADSKTELDANLVLNENEIEGVVHIKLNHVNLGLLLESLGIISGHRAATEKVSIKAKIRGSDLAEIVEQAEIKLQLGKGYWDLQSVTADQKSELLFDSASAFVCWEKPLELHIDGNIDGEPIKLEFKTNRLMEFFDEIQKMDVDINSNVADIDISLKGTLDLPIKTKQFNLYLSVKGNDLERLNTLLNTEFPPLNDFTLTGDLIANETGFIIDSAVASIGDTQLQTSIAIETNAPKPVWNVNLYSRQLQLNDFAFDDLNIEKFDTVIDNTSDQNNHDKLLVELLRQLEDKVRTPKTNFNLYLNVDNVLARDKHLGKAKLLLHQHDNLFHLENLDMEIPGGRIKASLSFKAESNEASGHAKLDIDRFDYGITAQLLDPDSKVDGVISARVDLQLRGSNFTRLLDHATGQSDIVVWPKNRQAESLLNMWTTNLFFMILPEINKKESKTNCMVALMNVDDGVMKEELFIFDTTKLWLQGNIEVDFKKEHVQLTLVPHSKKARMYALEAPMRVAGTFSDIHVILTPVDATATTLAFITSPIFAPLLRIAGEEFPEDGSAICGQLFDRAYTDSLKEKIKREEEKEIEEMLESD